MKVKKKAAIAAAAFWAAMNLSACAYGPPPEDYEESGSDISQTEYDPGENINGDVYGPPPEKMEETDTDMPQDEYDPVESRNAGIYDPADES